MTSLFEVYPYSDAKLPLNFSILQLIVKFHEMGSSGNQLKYCSPAVLTQDKLAKICNKIKEHPSTSIQQMTKKVQVLQMYATLTENFLYCISIVQEFKPTDLPRHLVFCKRFLHLMRDFHRMKVLDMA